MKHQNRIPTPIGQQIRRLRLTVVPFLVWLGAAAIAVYLWLSSPIASTFSGLVIGQETIVASPKDGLIEEVFVAPFEVVEAGQAIAMLSNASVDAQLLTAESELEGLRAAISSARAEIEREYEASQREANTDYELSISMARLELPAELRAFYDSENALELGILEKRLELAKSELKLADNRAQLERARASEEKKAPKDIETATRQIEIIEAEAESQRLSIDTKEARLDEGRKRRAALMATYTPPQKTLFPEPDFETLLAG